MATRPSRKERTRNSAQELLDRAEREVRTLSATGVDAGSLEERFGEAKAHFETEDFRDCEAVCSEILVLAKSMGAIASASKKGARRGGDRMSESLKAEVSRIVQGEVTNRLESAVRSLPTTSSIEEIIENKLQEALVTGGLMARIEGIAGEKAQAAVATMPKFTAKDAQAAANLVVQRALTQFLASKELGTRVRAAVEAEVGAAVDDSMGKITKETEALVNTEVAKTCAPLPTTESMEKFVDDALGNYTKTEEFEVKVIDLATERAKAEVARAPEVMAEAAGRIARNEADALFKTRMQADDFVNKVRQTAEDTTKDMMKAQSLITAEDVEVISRRVAEESLSTLAQSDVLKEKIEALAKKTVDGALSESGFDEKVKKLAGDVFSERISAVEEKTTAALKQLEELSQSLQTKEAATEEAGKIREDITNEVNKVRQDILTSEDFAEWIKDGVKAILDDLGLGEGVAGLEKKLVTSEKVEKIARHEALTAAMDLLETNEFTRRLLVLLDEETVQSKLGEIGGGSVDPEQVELIAKNAFVGLLDGDEFAEKMKTAGGGSVQDLSKRMMERMGRIETEALPAIVDRLVGEKMNDASAEGLGGKINEIVQKAVGAQLNPAAMQEQVLKMAQDNIGNIANTPGFKQMLEEKFKIMMKYLTQDVIPKQVKRVMGG